MRLTHLKQSSFLAKESLTTLLHTQFAESAKLEQAIKANLRGLGYGG